MAADEPPYLTVGTDVSAKYKGAFCEAKIKKVNRVVKCKVTYKNNEGTSINTDDQIRGTLRVGAHVQAKHPEKNQYLEAIINKIQDYSQYTVVFDDGDETTLRRTALCIKSGRHFAESPTLDQFPLTNPEHFSNPVIGSKSKRKRRSTMNSTSIDDYSSDEESVSPKKVKDIHARQKDPDIGKVVCVEIGDKRKKENWYPGLVVAPAAQDTVKINTKEDYLIRSFKDGKYYQVPKKETREFTKEVGSKADNNTLRTAVEKALLYLEKEELPPHWDRSLLMGLEAPSADEESHDSDSDTSDDEPSEEKDRFVAQLYKFMDERGTPINKAPAVGGRDLNLYKLFKVVHKMGCYNRVTNQNQWKTVYTKMGLPTSNIALSSNQIKVAYKRYLHSFEDFYRKLGCTMVTNIRSTRVRHRSDRHFMMTRNRDRDISATRGRQQSKEAREKKKEEEKLKTEDVSKEEKVSGAKKSDDSSTDSGKEGTEKTRNEGRKSLEKQKIDDSKRNEKKADDLKKAEKQKSEDLRKTEKPKTDSVKRLSKQKVEETKKNEKQKANDLRKSDSKKTDIKKNEKNKVDDVKKTDKSKQEDLKKNEKQKSEDLKKGQKSVSEDLKRSDKQKADETKKNEKQKFEDLKRTQKGNDDNKKDKQKTDEMNKLDKDKSEEKKIEKQKSESAKKLKEEESKKMEKKKIEESKKAEKAKREDTKKSDKQKGNDSPKKMDKQKAEDLKKLEKQKLEDLKKLEKTKEDLKKTIKTEDCKKGDKQKNAEDVKKPEKQKLEERRSLERQKSEDLKKSEKQKAEDRRSLENQKNDESKKVERPKPEGRRSLERQKSEDIRKLPDKTTRSEDSKKVLDKDDKKMNDSKKQEDTKRTPERSRAEEQKNTLEKQKSEDAKRSSEKRLGKQKIEEVKEEKGRVIRSRTPHEESVKDEPTCKVEKARTREDAKREKTESPEKKETRSSAKKEMEMEIREREENERKSAKEKSATKDKDKKEEKVVKKEEKTLKDQTKDKGDSKIDLTKLSVDQEDDTAHKVRSAKKKLFKTEDKTEKTSKDSDNEEEPTELEKDEKKEEDIEIGDRVKVKYHYCRGRQHKIYEAKVLKIDKEMTEKKFYVHYAGWNTRYDEWVKRNSIVENMSCKNRASRKKKQALAKEQILANISSKRGRPPARIPPGKLTRKNSASSISSVVSTSRTTRSDKSNLSELPFACGLEPRRRSRKKSGVSTALTDTSHDSESDGEIDVCNFEAENKSFEMGQDNDDVDDEKLHDMHDEEKEYDSDLNKITTIKVEPPEEVEDDVKDTSLNSETSFDVGDDENNDIENALSDSQRNLEINQDEEQVKINDLNQYVTVDLLSDVKEKEHLIEKVKIEAIDDSVEVPIHDQTIVSKESPKVSKRRSRSLRRTTETSHDSSENSSEVSSLSEKSAQKEQFASPVSFSPSSSSEIEKDVTKPIIMKELKVVCDNSKVNSEKIYKTADEKEDIDLSVIPSFPETKSESLTTNTVSSESETAVAEDDSTSIAIIQESKAFSNEQNNLPGEVSNETVENESTIATEIIQKNELVELEVTENDQDLKVEDPVKKVETEDLETESKDEVRETEVESTKDVCAPLVVDDSEKEAVFPTDFKGVINEEVQMNEETILPLGLNHEDQTSEKEGTSVNQNTFETEIINSPSNNNTNVRTNSHPDDPLFEENASQPVTLENFLPAAPKTTSLTVMENEVQLFELKDDSNLEIEDKEIESVIKVLDEDQLENRLELEIPVVKKESKKRKSKSLKMDKKQSGSSESSDEVKVKEGKKSKKKLKPDHDESDKSKDVETRPKSKKLKDKKNKNKKRSESDDIDSPVKAESKEDEFKDIAVEKAKKKDKKKKEEKKFNKSGEFKMEENLDGAKKKKGKKNKDKLGTDKKADGSVDKKSKKKKKIHLDMDMADSDSEKESPIKVSSEGERPTKISKKEKKKEKKKTKIKDASSSDDASDVKAPKETFIKSQDKDSDSESSPTDFPTSFHRMGSKSDEDPDMSFLLCEEKVPASPVGVDVLPEDSSRSTCEGHISVSEVQEIVDNTECANVEPEHYSRRNLLQPSEAVGKHDPEACAVLDNTPPTTPESSESVLSSSPSHERESYSQDIDSTRSGRESVEGESDSFPGELQVQEGSESEEYRAATTLAFDVCTPVPEKSKEPLPRNERALKRQKSDTEEASSPKKRKKSKRLLSGSDSSKMFHMKQRNSSQKVGKESKDNYDSSGANMSLLSPPHCSASIHPVMVTHPVSHITADGVTRQSSRPSRFNFYVPLDDYKDADKRIAILQEKLSELRKTYMALKAEVALIDRRRKKAKKKEKELATSAITPSSASQSNEVQCSS